jgi:hypothetical protein
MHELGYANPHLPSPSKDKITTPCKKHARTCNSAAWVQMFLSHAVYQQTFAWIGHWQGAKITFRI